MKRSTASATDGANRMMVRDVMRFSDRLGIREWVRGLDYFRCMEYPLVAEALRGREGEALLDMGCGSGPFALFLAHQYDYRVEVLDIDPECIAWQERGAAKIGLASPSFSATCGDSRCLPYPDETFSVVLNLGSIEHIRNEGDVKASREIARVLKPGGRSIITVPYGPQYTLIESGPHVSGFERRYDDHSLQERLITPSALVETSRTYFGEPGLAVSAIWYTIPWLLRLPVRRIAPHLARRWLAPIPTEEKKKAGGICLVLDKKL